jgi:hypothetical protein
MRKQKITRSQVALLPAEWQNEDAAAAYLAVSVHTLRGWRTKQCGPRFRKIGGKAVRYSTADLLAFVNAAPAGGGKAA